MSLRTYQVPILGLLGVGGWWRHVNVSPLDPLPENHILHASKVPVPGTSTRNSLRLMAVLQAQILSGIPVVFALACYYLRGLGSQLPDLSVLRHTQPCQLVTYSRASVPITSYLSRMAYKPLWVPNTTEIRW